MKNALLLLPILAALAGCRSNEDVFRDREMLKLHTEIAQRAYHSGQYDRAVHQARKALEFDPDHPLALVILGYTYLQAARYTADREARLRCLEDGETTLKRAVEHGSERDAAVFKA
ncbi:MAG: hypothetical protein MUC63_05245, partial [Planctomycetes bacterium]|nr:hypothetical protein [Planctomycetota bacterium]